MHQFMAGNFAQDNFDNFQPEKLQTGYETIMFLIFVNPAIWLYNCFINRTSNFQLPETRKQVLALSREIRNVYWNLSEVD